MAVAVDNREPIYYKGKQIGFLQQCKIELKNFNMWSPGSPIQKTHASLLLTLFPENVKTFQFLEVLHAYIDLKIHLGKGQVAGLGGRLIRLDKKNEFTYLFYLEFPK